MGGWSEIGGWMIFSVFQLALYGAEGGHVGRVSGQWARSCAYRGSPERVDDILRKREWD